MRPDLSEPLGSASNIVEAGCSTLILFSHWRSHRPGGPPLGKCCAGLEEGWCSQSASFSVFMVQGMLQPHLLVLAFSQWCLVYSWIVASWSPCEGYCVGDHLCHHVNNVIYGCLLLVELTPFSTWNFQSVHHILFRGFLVMPTLLDLLSLDRVGVEVLAYSASSYSQLQGRPLFLNHKISQTYKSFKQYRHE